MATNISNEARPQAEDTGLNPTAMKSITSASKLPPAVRVVKPTAPVQTASPPTLVPLGTNQSDIAFRLQIADQIWRYIAHGLVITDAAGIVQCANPAFINMLRYSAEQEVIGLDIRSLLPTPTDLDSVIHHLSERCICAKQIVVKTCDGSPLPVQLTASPVFLPNDQLGFMIFSMDDATADIEAEDLREQSTLQAQTAAVSQARLDAIAEMSYALNDPLQNLLALSEDEQRPDCQEQIKRVIEIVQQFRTPSQAAPEEDAATDDETLPTQTQEPTTSDDQLISSTQDLVMVVDDDPLTRQMFERLLSMSFPHLRIESAENGEQAIELFIRGHHTLIIMDIMTQGLRGDAAFTRISEICAEKNWVMPHVIFCTGFIPPITVAAISNDPWHTLLHKPVTRKDILDAVQQFLPSTPADA
ncbi:MAG: response regulator [Kiritimatiellia bacterium]|jgi:PAS domain S-box-containing protein